MATESSSSYTWICAACGRRVPRTVAVCRCGQSMPPDETPAAEPPSEPARAPRATGARRITLDEADFREAAAAVLSDEQASQLWIVLAGKSTARPKFDAAHVAYYAGAVLVLGAMGWFMTTAWAAIGGASLVVIATLYAAAFWFAGERLWRQGLTVPGGLLFTLAVWMVPLAVYGLESATGWWPQGDPGAYRGYYDWVKGSWLAMEIATIAAGVLAVRARPFAFITFPIGLALWFMSMDLTPLLFGKADFTWDDRKIVSVCFGLAVLLVSYLADLRNRLREDFAFWGYLFGLLAFWGGLTMMNGGSEVSRLLYCLVNVGLVVLSVLLRQRAFLVFGAFGVLGYVGHLASRVFADSFSFPVVLTALGVGIIYLGVWYQRNGARIAAAAHDRLSPAVLDLIPPRARALA